jgi:hypothetical protein
MAEVVQSGAGKTGNAALGDHGLLPIEQVLCTFPGTDYDKPLPSIAGFDKLAETHTADQIEYLSRWIAPQTTVAYILRHHTAQDLKRVISGIARACEAKRIPMSDRVAAMAQALGIEVV